MDCFTNVDDLEEHRENIPAASDKKKKNRVHRNVFEDNNVEHTSEGLNESKIKGAFSSDYKTKYFLFFNYTSSVNQETKKSMLRFRLLHF